MLQIVSSGGKRFSNVGKNSFIYICSFEKSRLQRQLLLQLPWDTNFPQPLILHDQGKTRILKGNNKSWQTPKAPHFFYKQNAFGWKASTWWVKTNKKKPYCDSKKPQFKMFPEKPRPSGKGCRRMQLRCLKCQVSQARCVLHLPVKRIFGKKRLLWSCSSLHASFKALIVDRNPPNWWIFHKLVVFFVTKRGGRQRWGKSVLPHKQF